MAELLASASALVAPLADALPAPVLEVLQLSPLPVPSTLLLAIVACCLCVCACACLALGSASGRGYQKLGEDRAGTPNRGSRSASMSAAPKFRANGKDLLMDSTQAAKLEAATAAAKAKATKSAMAGGLTDAQVAAAAAQAAAREQTKAAVAAAAARSKQWFKEKRAREDTLGDNIVLGEVVPSQHAPVKDSIPEFPSAGPGVVAVRSASPIVVVSIPDGMVSVLNSYPHGDSVVAGSRSPTERQGEKRPGWGLWSSKRTSTSPTAPLALEDGKRYNPTSTREKDGTERKRGKERQR